MLFFLYLVAVILQPPPHMACIAADETELLIRKIKFLAGTLVYVHQNSPWIYATYVHMPISIVEVV